jgi:tetratricopeptide (TPR) repeat protein
MWRKLVVIVVCCAFALAGAQSSTVKVWEEPLVIPTYVPGPPDPNPMFYAGRTYQGAKGAVYPYPLYDKLTDKREDRTYKALYLENEYVKLCVLPEIGGRIFSAVDKTNGYDFFYRQTVIKPALIGMLGAWISGGVEWNYPHHHRASSFLPVEYRLEENADGSKTIWVGEIELRQRLKWTIGLTLRPGKSHIEASFKLLNRTPLPYSFLCFANVAVHTNPDYQIIFPPGTQFVTQHAKREFARWPIADSVYGGVDFTKGVDVSRWKNHPSSISMFAWNYEDDFLAGYDHGKQAGTLHVADHHIVPGKKFWTWGAGLSGQMWDRILSDKDGPYVELMVGAYSDNQPDYSWAQPYEVKSFQQFWYPFRQIGGVKNANLEAAVNLEVSKEGKAKLGFHSTSPRPEVVAMLRAKGKVIFEEKAAIGPDKPLVREVAIPAGVKEEDLRASLSAGGRELIAYQPQVRKREPMPAPVQPPPPPSEVKTNEELYLAGLRLEQFHSPALEPYPYYEEALKRDPGDARVNTALAILYLKRGMYWEAEERLRAAIERLTRNYTSPKDGEAYYYLGLALKAQGKLEEAYAALYKATWSYAWEAASYYGLAEIACLRGELAGALAHLDRSIAVNALNTRALNLKATVLRRMGRSEQAARVAASVTAIDPLDLHVVAERYLARKTAEARAAWRSRVNSDAAGALEIALEYGNAGLYEEAMELLGESAAAAPNRARVSPLVYYYLGYFGEKRGQAAKALEYYRQAAKMPADYVFPFQVEAAEALRSAMKANPGDARAPYYLGNLLYDLQPEKAVAAWEAARSLDANFPIVHRNLAFAYSKQEDGLEKAVASLERAIELKPDDPMFLFEIDQLYEIVGASLEKRFEMLNRHHATVLKRDDTLSHEIALRVQLGQYDQAIELLKGRRFHIWEGGARFGVHESWVDAHLLRGHARLAAKKYKEALADYQAALEYPDNLETARPYRGGRYPEILYWAGNAMEALGEKGKATAAWKQSASQLLGSEEDPRPSVDRGAALLYYQALSLQKLGQNARARGIFSALVKVGTAALKESAAIDYFAKFGERQSRRNRMAQAHYVVGLGYLGLEEKAKAREEFQEALGLNAYHLEARTRLAALD